MFEVFENYLRRHVILSDVDVERIRSCATLRKMRKWQPLLQSGEVWKINCFIVSGCLRLYRIDEGGRDHTLRFAIDNWWITDLESYNHHAPSDHNIEALSASVVFTWTKEQWTELMKEIPSLRNFNEILLNNSYEASQRRIYSLISYGAEEKYTEFQKTYPGIFHRVPLHMVASYLGISRETLSRIRKQVKGGDNKGLSRL